ncbi:MAG: acylphosphatase [Trichormus sp.]
MKREANALSLEVDLSKFSLTVGYRYATVDTASQLGLTGWVRNLPDGRVEAVFEGAPEIVEEIIHWCHAGPPAAIVQDVAVEYEHPEGLPGFEVKRVV